MEQEHDNAIPRSMPHSLEAEQSVIGAMIADRDAIDAASNLISADDFYDRQLGLLFDCILSLDAEHRAIDTVTLLERLRERGAPPQLTDMSYIGSLINGTPVIRNARDYAQIIREKATLRRLIHASQDIENQCFTAGDRFQDVLDEAERSIFAITQQGDDSEVEPIRRTVADTLAQIEAASRNKGNVTGVATHYADLDYYTSGFQPSDLILIAARPSMGKTALALNIARNMVLKGKQSVVIFSLEMPRKQLMMRFLSMDARVNAKKLRVGDLTEDEWAGVLESGDSFGRSSLIIDDKPGISVSEIRSRCRKYKAEKNIAAVFIDYLQIMSGSGKKTAESRQQEISDISRSLKSLARELNVPVVALSQLSREVEKRPDKRPMLSDLRESGAIEQDADVVMFIYRDEYYKKENSERKGIADIIIAKQRNGPTETFEMAWLGEYTRFETLERKKN